MIEMDSKKWNEKIKNNFNDAAYRYLEYSNIQKFFAKKIVQFINCLLYTSPSPRDALTSRMPSSA